MQDNVKQFKYLLTISFAWILPVALWWATISEPNKRDFANRANEILGDSKKTITAFEQEYGSVPTNLSMLRSFAKLRNKSFAPYDTNGQRLDYVRFDKRHYLLRSFGQDGEQDHGKSLDDHVVGRVQGIPEKPYSHIKKDKNIETYDSALLLGSKSPDGKWYAQLYIDKLSGAKRLAVRKIGNNKFYLIVYHDGVEEFRWIPGSPYIIFTATSSGRYQDGLFLWDLTNDKVVDVMKISKVFSKNIETLFKGIDKLHLSLVKLDENQRKLYFLIYPNHEEALSPFQWVGMSSIFTLDIDSVLKEPIRPVIEEYQTKETYSILSSFWKSKEYSEDGLLTQKSYTKVRKQNLKQRLKSWNAFVEKHYHTPVSSYAIWRWVLDHMKALTVDDFKSDRVQIMKNLKDLSVLLIKDRTAPSYLRFLSLYIHDQAQKGQTKWLIQPSH